MNITPTPTEWLMMVGIGLAVFVATYLAGNQLQPAADAVAAYVSRL